MFLGHFAVGFAAKRVAPAVSLGTLFLAAQFADLLWPNLLLLAAVAWSAQAVWLLVALGYWVDRHRYATVALPRASA